MNVKINDREHDIETGATVGSVMAERNIQPKGVAVALNGHLVTADKWAETVLSEGDSLVVIKAFYGG